MNDDEITDEIDKKYKKLLDAARGINTTSDELNEESVDENKSEEIKTVLGTKNSNLISDKVVVCSILRAGLPLHQGILNYFDQAEKFLVINWSLYHKK